MHNWEEVLKQKSEEICEELGYSESADEIYNIFHELLELDDTQDEYRHRISEKRRNNLSLLVRDTLASSDDADNLINFMFDEMDLFMK